MSSPYGHSLVGLGLFHLYYPRWFASCGKTLLIYGLVILGACSPDLDFLPGIFVGNPSRFHHGYFHSLGMAMVLSLTVGFLLTIFRFRSSFGKTVGFVLTLVFSHFLLDFFTADFSPPYGFPLLWPFSETYFISPWPILPFVERDLTNPAFWDQAIRVFTVESLFFLPFFWLCWRLRKIGNQRLPK